MTGRKGLALAIISKMPKPGSKGDNGNSDKYSKDDSVDGDGDNADDTSGDNEGYVAAFRALRKAVEGGDDEAGADALKDFVSMC